MQRRVGRYLLAILGLLAVIAGLAGIKFTQISSLIKMGHAMEKAGPPPEAVSTAVVQEQAWQGAMSAVGSITPAKGVSVSNDVPGVVSKISFESGAMVREGQVLLEIDASVERAQLGSLRSRRDLAKVTYERSKSLRASDAIAQAQLDQDEAAYRTAVTDLEALDAQIARKVVRAPFAGKLGIRQVNIGQYLNAGTTITALESLKTLYVDFTLPQQTLSALKIGMPVKVTVEGMEGTAAEGTLAAIDPQVDVNTRTIKLRASLPGAEEKLRPGMFANVSVVLPDQGAVIIVPATAIIHAPYGDSVFVVEDKKTEAGAPIAGPDGKPVKIARQQFVRLGEARGDFVAVVEGVKPGQEVVTAGAFKLRNGSPITVNNSVGARPEVDPHPENR